MHSPPARYLVLIEASGTMEARLFDAQRRHLADLDAATEELNKMIAGLTPQCGAEAAEWGSALVGHSVEERCAAQVFTLSV